MPARKPQERAVKHFLLVLLWRGGVQWANAIAYQNSTLREHLYISRGGRLNPEACARILDALGRWNSLL